MSLSDLISQPAELVVPLWPEFTEAAEAPVPPAAVPPSAGPAAPNGWAPDRKVLHPVLPRWRSPPAAAGGALVVPLPRPPPRQPQSAPGRRRPQVWRRLERLVFTKLFEKLLWDALGLTRTARYRDIRLQARPGSPGFARFWRVRTGLGVNPSRRGSGGRAG